MIKAKWLLAALIAVTALAVIIAWPRFQLSAPSIARDFEECAEQAKATSAAQRAALLTDCGARFAGRRKPDGGYSYYDFMQDRSFHIVGPNPTADERKQIDQEYMKYLDFARRDVRSSELAQQQNNLSVADAGSIPTTFGQAIGPSTLLTPKKLPSAKSAARRSKIVPVPCPEDSLACNWEKLTSAVRHAFASASKPE